MLTSIPLSVQVDMILDDLKEELCGLTAGAVFLHIDNERVATYGIRHRLEHRLGKERDGQMPKQAVSEKHLVLLKEMAAELVGRRARWGSGTVTYRFSIRQGALHLSSDFVEKDGLQIG